jgi:DNA-directed RNA polymerase subunit RPC12/RpoP
MKCETHGVELAQFGSDFNEYTCARCKEFHTYSQRDLGHTIRRYCKRCSRDHTDLLPFEKTRESSAYLSCPECWDELLQG